MIIGFCKHVDFYVRISPLRVIARSEATWQSVSQTFQILSISVKTVCARGNGLPRQSADWLAMTRKEICLQKSYDCLLMPIVIILFSGGTGADPSFLYSEEVS